MSANAAKKKVVLKLRTMIDTGLGAVFIKDLSSSTKFSHEYDFYTSNFRQWFFIQVIFVNVPKQFLTMNYWILGINDEDWWILIMSKKRVRGLS